MAMLSLEMAMFNAPQVVSEDMKVHSNNKNYEEHLINNDELDISNSILKSNEEETCNGNDKENVEENLSDIVHDAILSNGVDNCYNHEKLGNYGVSDALVNNNCQNDGSDIEEPSSTGDKCNNDKFNRDNNNISEKILSKRLLDLVDTDTDEEATWYKILNKESSTVDDKCHSGLSEHLENVRNKKDSKNNRVRRVIDSESEDDIQTSNLHDFNQIVHKSVNTATNKYQTLIDSESEEEKEEVVHNSLITFDNADTSKSKNTKKKSVKKRKGSIRASKDEAMRQIYSESQRLLRETKISLPYHRPKQRTLQEFLNRKKISATLPKAPSTAAKLKMASAILSQALAEKEKEAELFYKSSDSEDDMQQPVSFASKDIKQSSNISEKMALTNIKQTCIQDTQDIETSNKDSYNEREIVQDLDEQAQQNQLNEQVQQDHLDEQEGLDASGTLFGKNFCEVDHQNRELFPLTKNNNNRDDKSDILSRQIENGHKQDLQKLGVSRKLFDINFKNETNEISDKSHEEVTKAIVETIITSFDKEKCINDKPEMNMTGNHTLEILKAHQCYSEVANGNRDENLIAESMKILDTLNHTNNKEIAEMLHKDNNMTSNVTSSNSDDCTIIQDGNNERKDKCIKTNDISSSHIIISGIPLKLEDNSLIEKCEKTNSHVLGLPLPKFTDEILTNREKLLPKLTLNSKVTLKGSPGMIIDLTDDAKSNGKGVNILLDRFFCKHIINTKNQADNKSEVTVTYLQDTQEGLPLSKEFSYKLPTNTDNSELNKPGAKLKRLKEDLKLQMVLKRNKEWKQKEVELQAQEKEWNEKEESDYEFDGQEQANNFGFSDSEESEPEENDVCIKDKKRKTHLFADDEAEVTDDEDSSTNTEETYNENDTEHRKEHIDDNISEIETDQEEQEDDEEDLNADMENRSDSDFKDDDNANVYQNINIVGNEKNRKTKQLIEELQDNSNIKNSNYLENNNQLKNITTDVDAAKTFCKDNSWINENEDNVPIYQQHVEVATRSQLCNTPLAKTSILDIVSPITQLSVLNSTLNSNKKDSSEKREYLVDKDESVFMKSIQSDESSEHACNIRNKTIIKKKLFDDVEETINDDYLMQLCSGKFEFTQKTDLNPKDLSSQSNTTESQLPELCSGNINMKLVDIKQLENSEVENGTPSENVKLILNEDSDKSAKHIKVAKKVSTVDSALKLRIVSSDDEDLSDETDTFLKSKNRLAKRFNLSDSEEEIVQSSDDENNDIDNEEAEQYIDYDSEENEVIVVPKKDIKKVAASFLEEEAVLSESDWDSADEDEKDLDNLEFEEADSEHIDEHKVKDQLEKIHMKQILDEDKREVRLLKELLFEDGDLHTDGTGRERKFKWRNIDKLGNNSEMPQIPDENDGWVDMQEDEEEAKWHKLRHERDKFLEERMKCSSNEIEEELCDSQIFKFGLKALKKTKDNKSQKQDDPVDKIDLSENMEPIVPRNITDLLNGPNIGKKSQMLYNVMKKRSLLTRGEESLARIASLAKQGDPVFHNLNTRNFVFQYIDPSTDNISKEDETRKDRENKHRKRKMTSDFPLTMKKRRK